MKILNTLVVSALMALSLSSTAMDFETNNREINRILQERIEASLKLGELHRNSKTESQAGTETQSELLNVLYEQKLTKHRS